MIFTSYIQKLKALFQHREALEASPRRDWAVLIGLVVLGLIASVWWNTNYFFEVVEGGDEASSGEVVGETTEASLGRVEDGFLERAQRSQKYQNESLFVDPSN